MGRESKALKGRVCRNCKERMYLSAEELRAHGAMCARATSAGIIIPKIVMPENMLIKLTDQ